MNAATRSRFIATLLLAAAMWITRSHQLEDHFGSLAQLPDTSWAVFFIAGLIGARWWAPTFLLANAAVIDYLALLGGVSDYCVTPAYPFLIPAYMTLWASGRWAAFDAASPARTIARAAFALLAGVTGAFIISNAGFYALAGYFASMSALDYSAAVFRYWPKFLESAAIYSSLAMIILFAAAERRSLADRASAS